MIIDIVFLLVMVMAIFKGLSKGLIVAVFSIVAYIIGIAAALRFSSAVAKYLSTSSNVSSKWLPLLSFILVFIGVVLLVKLGAAFIQKTFQVVMLGWLNRLGGIVFYILIYTLIFSIFLFYAQAMGFIKPDTIRASATYSYVQPWGPKVIENLGKIIPFFKDMFQDLQDFFSRITAKPKLIY